MILDTCGLLWLASGDSKLSRSTLKRINVSPALYISAISAFEIALKAGKGKLRLPQPPQQWFENIIDHHNITVLPLDLEICIAAAQLPPIHDDPFDRFIIATAKSINQPVVTADENFENYGVTVFN